MDHRVQTGSLADRERQENDDPKHNFHEQYDGDDTDCSAYVLSLFHNNMVSRRSTGVQPSNPPYWNAIAAGDIRDDCGLRRHVQ